MDERYYAFLILTERERVAYDDAYRSAMKVARSKEVARRAAERAVFIEARRERNARLDGKGQR